MKINKKMSPIIEKYVQLKKNYRVFRSKWKMLSSEIVNSDVKSSLAECNLLHK